MLIYNNGDPAMFNPAAKALLNMFKLLDARGLLSGRGEPRTYLDMARRPIEIVSDAQHDFCEAGSRLVGGKLHDLAVTPNDEYISTTGDDQNVPPRASRSV